MSHYYDLVLALIPVSLVGIVGLLVTVGIPTSSAIPLGAAVSLGLIGHALFINSPTDHTSERTQNRSTPGVNVE